MHNAAPAPKLTRRDLLQVGSVGAMGLGLPSLLLADNASAEDTGSRRNEKSCIFILQYGGAPQHDMWDLKPDAPEEIRGAFRPIATNVPGINICEKMPLLAQRADRYCIVRSMQTTNGGHDGAMHICMTGNRLPNDRTPYYGSIMAKLRPATGALPSYAWVQNLAGDVKPWYKTGGVLGMAYSPLQVGRDLNNPSNPKFRFTGFDPPEECSTQRLSLRHQLLQQLDRHETVSSSPAMSFTDLQQQAVELVTGNEAKQAFDLSHEPDTKRTRYGMHPLGQNLLMARRLIEAGVRLVTVVAFTGVPPGQKFKNVQTWDMHGVLYKPDDNIFGSSAYGLSWALPNVDQAVSALLDDLTDRRLLDSTLVAMVGEFGRTPKVNKRGRDHWPHAYSAMLAGCGVRGGMVYGSTDKQAAYVKDNPVFPEDFSATLFEALGVPPQTRFGPDGFTFQVSTGQPVMSLLS
ncbi:MAG: DUF1501 domain-containing protein [Planctomycetaceae bacterium]|jgi:hypothetical protein|nr:DUF1501 domain-containing protein [Planctomycetaceae bacterium]